MIVESYVKKKIDGFILSQSDASRQEGLLKITIMDLFFFSQVLDLRLQAIQLLL